jgi:hypothetical protein
MYEPTTLECSHRFVVLCRVVRDVHVVAECLWCACARSFCRACLALNSLNSVKCPNCRSEVLVRPPFPLDARLQSLLKKSFPKEYEVRARCVFVCCVLCALVQTRCTHSSVGSSSDQCAYLIDTQARELDNVESKEAFDKITPLIVGNLYYELKTTSSNKNNCRRSASSWVNGF